MWSAADPWFMQALEEGAEVARIELDDPGGINTAYTSVPALGPERVDNKFFEVSTVAHGIGVGARLVQALVDRYPIRRLFACSEESHGFWSARGWARFDHPGRE